MQKRLAQIIELSGLTLTQIARKTGIPQPYISMMLSGKRPISTENWLKVLTKIEGMTKSEAQVQLAKWQIEDAQKVITKNHIVVHGSHNEIKLGESDSEDELTTEISNLSAEDKILLKKLIKTLREK